MHHWHSNLIIVWKNLSYEYSIGFIWLLIKSYSFDCCMANSWYIYFRSFIWILLGHKLSFQCIEGFFFYMKIHLINSHIQGIYTSILGYFKIIDWTVILFFISRKISKTGPKNTNIKVYLWSRADTTSYKA